MGETKNTNRPENGSRPVVSVRGLTVGYRTRDGLVEAVRDVSFDIHPKETLGLVGESGCGKSTVAFALVNALGPNGQIGSGRILFDGQDLVGKSQQQLRALRGDRIAMVFQDPMQALNPSLRIGRQLIEVLTSHRPIGRQEARQRAVGMLRRVQMPDPHQVMDRYPHQLSGGQQQRVVIAMAMLNHPALLLMDEPTTALDVTVEAAVLDLVEDLKRDFDTANLFITHNLGVVARVSDRVCVMYAGQVVEQAPTDELFRRPAHPYTRGLLNCLPRLGQSKHTAVLSTIDGRVPRPDNRPADACVFAPRCHYAIDRCRRQRPAMVRLTEAHQVRCLLADAPAGQQRAVKASKGGGKAEAVRPDTDKTGHLLLLEGAKVYYRHETSRLVDLLGLGQARFVKAVDNVSLRLRRGRTLGIVGESGCGKSSLVKGIIGLEPLSGGRIDFLGLTLNQTVTRRDLEVVRQMQMVFQNPDSTLNPVYSVGRQIARPMIRFKTVPRVRVKSEVLRLLEAVRLGPSYYYRLPRQLSGGEKQRVGIARALACKPDLIICDEPVSALDVSVQGAVINLLLDIQSAFGTTMIFIAHDLSVVRYLSDEIAVMYLGQVVEIGPAQAIYRPPYHPYTEALLSAVPIPDPDADQARIRLIGNVPSALDPPAGCRFHTRCPRRGLAPGQGALCARKAPDWQQNGQGHRILCHIPIETLKQLPPVLHPAA
ncbi:MAG: ABC transporter ATP-binding protein [Deltaproteobacteria bacterium]|nr:ABC transporter ATP-binding protein [Deltaproteobacteria bacterium]MBW2128574.1 ABC transporter ATP-binding protein [Deltaproteobacteria bacterium]MBW2303142.1 ABC transporter ATP-binding protein [Deltaproteobacteria bacterium]